MNTMLELSKNADYDILAASLIFAFAIAAKLWLNSKRPNSKSEAR